MSIHDDYIGCCRAVVILLSDVLSPEECAEADHLIDHGEPAEGMRSLAWSIVEGNKRVPAEVIAEIKGLTADLVPEEHMPPGLDALGLDKNDGKS
jgi:hypothetical protein